MELRSAWDVGVLELSGGKMAELKRILADQGISVSCIGSSVGKTGIGFQFGKAMDSLRKAIDIAHSTGTKYIRIFSFFSEGKDFASHKEAIIYRFEEMAQLAEENGVVLLNENENDIFTNTGERCLAVVEAVKSPHLRCAFDPSNFRSAGERPFDQSLPPLYPYVEYVHVKDSRNSDGSKVPAGEGDAQVREVLHALAGKEGLFLSLEPHLAVAGQFRGFSGPEKFKLAHDALIRLLGQLQIGYV